MTICDSSINTYCNEANQYSFCFPVYLCYFISVITLTTYGNVELTELIQGKIHSMPMFLRKLCFTSCDTNLLPGDSKGFFPDDPGHSLCTRWRGEWAIIRQVEVRELRHQPGQWEWLQEHHSAVGHPDSLQQLHYLLQTHVVVLCFRDLKSITSPFQFLCVYTIQVICHTTNTYLFISLSCTSLSHHINLLVASY